MPDLDALRIILLSLLPGTFWLVYLRSLSGGKVPPWWQWVLALLAGWGSTELTLLLSDTLKVDALHAVPYVGGWLLYFVVGVGLVEEAAKAVCALVALKLPGFAKRPMFALQLSGGVALGFATAENVLYATNYGQGVLVGRFVFATLGHVLFSSLWGFKLGQGRDFLSYLLLAAAGHGLYDWFLMTGRPVLAILTLVVLWVGFREAALGAYLRQLYRRELPFPLQACQHCGVLTRSEANYCSFCGERIGVEGEPGGSLSR